jgi:hypothetical protein
MKKLTTIAVAIGVMCLGIGVAGGTAAADEPVNASASLAQGKHNLTFNRATNFANKLARQECDRDVNCVAFAVGPECSSNNRHKWTCPIHKLYGPTGLPAPDPATQQDCVRPAQILIKRVFGLKIFYKWFSSTYTCGPNTQWVF